MKSSITSRSAKLLSLASKVGRKELGQNLKDKFNSALNKSIDEITSGRMKTRLEQARLITEHLSQLKGAAMKAGQLLSLDAADYFPPEAIEILSKLQSQSDPVEWKVIREVLVRELGEKDFAELKNLSERAAASASIGQVHRAELNGTPVAIKVQYPGVADSIDSDLAILKKIAQSLLLISGKKISLDELFAELSVVLKQEADYAHELENMKEFGRLLKGNPDYAVPTPIESHSTERVLTMTWQEGLTINDWLKTNPSMADRERIGHLALDLYFKEFIEWGFVQTDPNYANFLIQQNPLRLVLLDFGAALKYSVEFRRDYKKLLETLQTLDRQKMIRSFIEFGLIDDRESDEAKNLFADFLTLAFEPFQPSRQPFHFRDTDFAARSREVGQKFAQSLKFSPPPRQIIFLHRKLGGVFTLLKRLDLTMDLRPHWEKVMGAEI